MRDIRKQKYWNTKEGWVCSEETRQRMRIAAKKRGIPETFGKYDKFGANNPFYGKTHTEETRKKMSKPRKPEFRDTMKDVATGYKWYNNGLVTRRFKEGDEVPDNFVPGRLPITEETRNKLSQSAKARKRS
jgi:hypothetical protein